MGRKARLKRERTAAFRRDFAVAREKCEAEGATVVATPRGLPRVSDGLVDVAKPLLSEVGPNADLDTVNGIITIAALVWNLGSAASKDPDLVESVFRDVEREEARLPITRAALEELLRRRRELYPHDQRIVMQFQVTQSPGGGFHVIAASKLTDADPFM